MDLPPHNGTSVGCARQMVTRHMALSAVE